MGRVKQNRRFCGAGDGTRTRDNLLGRQALYLTELLPQDELYVNSMRNQMKNQARDQILNVSMEYNI